MRALQFWTFILHKNAFRIKGHLHQNIYSSIDYNYNILPLLNSKLLKISTIIRESVCFVLIYQQTYSVFHRECCCS